MQRKRQQLLLITGYKYVCQEECKFPIHSQWNAVGFLPQPSYVTSSCKSAIGFSLCTWSYTHIKALKISKEGFCILCQMSGVTTKCWEGYTRVIPKVQGNTIFFLAKLVRPWPYWLYHCCQPCNGCPMDTWKGGLDGTV